MNKRPRRSERTVAIRESKWNAAERVIHDKYLWMQIARWHIDAFLGLSKITRADQSDTLEFRKALVRDLMFVYELKCGELIHTNKNVPISSCDYGGLSYVVYWKKYTKRGNLRLSWNPLGASAYHNCDVTRKFVCKGKEYGGWFESEEDAEYTKKGLKVYRDNPFAELFFITPPSTPESSQ